MHTIAIASSEGFHVVICSTHYVYDFHEADLRLHAKHVACVFGLGYAFLGGVSRAQRFLKLGEDHNRGWPRVWLMMCHVLFACLFTGE